MLERFDVEAGSRGIGSHVKPAAGYSP